MKNTLCPQKNGTFSLPGRPINTDTYQFIATVPFKLKLE